MHVMSLSQNSGVKFTRTLENLRIFFLHAPACIFILRARNVVYLHAFYVRLMLQSLWPVLYDRKKSVSITQG